MTTNDDRRLIEDYLPIEAISAESSREKSVRKGHISTLHIWWARRPLVACRAAVYGALVPAPASKGGRGPKSDFVKRLCKYPGDPKVIAEAQRHILEAHAERLSKEMGKPVTVKDIEEGKAPRPKVLDMFAGGGAIPLEALRLGCDAYALELNPVAHIIELCTLVYPQRYGKPDKNAKGSASDGTWAGLAKEVEYWGKWVMERVKAEISDLYPPIPDPKSSPQKLVEKRQEEFGVTGFEKRQPELATPGGYLTPVAYLWTRTVKCKNPACGATVPLVRQTWLCKKPNRYAALRMIAPSGQKSVHFEVVETSSESSLGFDPEGFSSAGNSTCMFCGTVADTEYIRLEGQSLRIGSDLMALVCVRNGEQGKVYLSGRSLENHHPDEEAIKHRIQNVSNAEHILIPNEILVEKLTDQLPNYGIKSFKDLFTNRQLLCMLTFAAKIRQAENEMRTRGINEDLAKTLVTYLALSQSRTANFSNTLCLWNYTGGRGVVNSFSRQALQMTWDFPESNPLYTEAAGWESAIDSIVSVLQMLAEGIPAEVSRGSATNLPFDKSSFDAIVTDPPYYDNIQYAPLSDFFYVWLRRSIGHLYPEHFSSELTPKRNEIVASPWRHRNKLESAAFYDRMMKDALREAHRVLKPGGPLIIVYAHKTTMGWATLVDVLRISGLTVMEAWPLDTERQGGMKVGKAMLASSVFLVTRKRERDDVGEYENKVRAELESTVRERVETLWGLGVSGADLVIAAVGAGLRALTRFARVEYANGEEVPAQRFLGEVEGVVLETLLDKIFGLVGAKVSSVDGSSQFYVLWRYAYHTAELDAGEAIVFTYGLPVELDGQRGLSAGAHALVEKKKNKYRLRDFAERGHDQKLGLPSQQETQAPLIDILHRVLYLVENQPGALPQFLTEAQPNLERLRLVANTLAGPQLKGNGDDNPRVATTAREQAALNKLVANWRTLMEGPITPEERSGVKRRFPGL